MIINVDVDGISQEQVAFLKLINQQFVAGCQVIDKVQGKKATIYGGHSAVKGSKLYEETFEIGKVLANRGYTIMNGGGPGMMEAATAGAESADGNTVAITMDIKNEPPQTIADQIIPTTIFSVRKYLLYSSDVLIYVPGGWGTLDELAEVVILSRFDKIPDKKIYLYNREFWEDFYQWVNHELVKKWGLVSEEYTKILEIIDSPAELERALDKPLNIA
ncbi:MAG: TIGR00730 family Rossman fold protein [Patescibacteria group bacterium]